MKCRHGRIFILVLLALLIMNSSVFAQTKTTGKTMELKIGHMRPEGSNIDNNVKFFTSEIEKRTNGRIKFKIYPANQLGDYEVVQQRITMGDVDMFIGSIGVSSDKALSVVTCPYLVSTWTEVKKFYNTKDGLMAEFVRERLAKQDIQLLACHPMYFGSIALLKEPKDPKNPNSNKSVKVRIPANKAFDEMAKTIGFMTTPLPSSENFTSVQTGIVDGVIGGGGEYYWGQLKDVTKYILPLNTHLECHWLSMNKPLWKKLSPEDQKIVMDVSGELEQRAFTQAIAETDKYNDLFRKAGVTVYDYTDSELMAFATKVRKEAWPKIIDSFGNDGKEIFEKMRKALGL